MGKVSRILGQQNHIFKLIENILEFNQLTINDKVSQSEPIVQTNGVLQGDPLSPFLFNLLTHDVVHEVASPDATALLYADDVVILSRNKLALQTSLDKLHDWAHRNELEVNTSKTKVMKFRRGGNVNKEDTFKYGNARLELTNCYKYLGVTLQVTGKTFTKHIQERCNAAIKATFDIRNVEKLSVETALRLFHLKISPIACYAITIIWTRLNAANLKRLEAVKTTYLRRALRIPRWTRSRIVYHLSNTDFFIREIAAKYNLPHTPAYEAHIRERSEKAEDIDQSFLLTPAMNTDEWKNPNFPLRHVFTRMAAHGFHYRICNQKGFHHASNQCLCTLCNQTCGQYHLLNYTARRKSLKFYADDINFQ